MLAIRKTERTFPAIEANFEGLPDPTDTISLDVNVLEAMTKGVAIGLPSDEVRVTMTASGAGQNAQLEISTTNALGRRSHEHTQCGRVTNGEISWPVSFKHLIDCTQALKNADDVITMQVMQDRSFLIFAEDSKERTIRTFVPFRTDQAIEQERAEAAKLAKDKPKEAVATEGAPTRDTDEDIDIE
jgi:5-hydroxyisourate hydrolase-like protein (transthyretin family)